MAEHTRPRQQRTSWETRLPGIKTPVLTSQTTRTNPLVVGELVFASIFSPGAVCAAKRKTGEPLWLNQLHSFGSESVFLHGGNLYAKSSRTQYVVDPSTGRVRWEFSPVSGPGEWLYSSPSVRAGRVFFGDRCGYFHCLDGRDHGPENAQFLSETPFLFPRSMLFRFLESCDWRLRQRPSLRNHQRHDR